MAGAGTVHGGHVGGVLSGNRQTMTFDGEHMAPVETGCPTCKSADTISTEATLVRDTRHCFGCRRSFDIELSGPPQLRLRREDRSNALASERRR